MASFIKDPTHYAHPLFQSNELPKPFAKKNKAPNKKLPTWMSHTVKQGYTSYLVHTNATTLEPKDYRPPRHVGGFEPTGEQFETNESFTIEEMSSHGQKEAAKAFLREFVNIKKDEEAKIPEDPVSRKEYIEEKKNKNKNLKTGKQRGKEKTLLIWSEKTKVLIKILKEIVKDSNNKFDQKKHDGVIKTVKEEEVKEQLDACGNRGKQLFNYLENYNLMSRKWKSSLQDTDKMIKKHKEYKEDIKERTNAYKDESKNPSDILSGSYKNKDKISKKMKKEIDKEEEE